MRWLLEHQGVVLIEVAQTGMIANESGDLIQGQYTWGRGVVVSHALRMRKAPGSNPGTSTIFFHFLLFH